MILNWCNKRGLRSNSSYVVASCRVIIGLLLALQKAPKLAKLIFDKSWLFRTLIYFRLSFTNLILHLQTTTDLTQFKKFVMPVLRATCRKRWSIEFCHNAPRGAIVTKTIDDNVAWSDFRNWVLVRVSEKMLNWKTYAYFREIYTCLYQCPILISYNKPIHSTSL